MKLIPVDPANEEHLRVLYDLLAERSPEQSISHRKMPTWEEHCRHVADFERIDWCLIQNAAGIVGCVYLTHAREIGISIFREFQGHGFGPVAVKAMMQKHSAARRYLANVNPANEPSRKMFEKLGFNVVQHTYALEAK